jgi:transcription elongation factor GreA
VQIGHTVTISINDMEQTFKILGSTETNPGAGIISYQSPLGAALMGHNVGDTVLMKIADREIKSKIVKIE